MNNISEFYNKQVNAQWPTTVPPLSAVEAERAARRLYRVALGKPCQVPIKLTSGRCYSYIRGGALRVNPERGWRELVHDLSHTFFRRTPQGRVNRPHSGQHASLERLLIRYVVDHGWLEGKLKPKVVEKPAKDPRAVRYARTLASIARWTAKQKRAATALKKLALRKRYYERLGVAA